ncbi:MULTISPECIES: endonuclease/exonuclease/phosphatase family protein [Chitinophagaceae]
MARSLLAIFIVSFFSCTTTKAQTTAASNGTLKVMTYNTHHCNPPEKPNIIDVAAIAAVIRKENPDIVALQEIDANTNRCGKINEAAELSIQTGLHAFYFGKAMDYDGGQYGIMILSKYPLSDTKTDTLPRANGKGEPRVMVTATISLPNGKTIRFGSTHLEAYNKESRIMQITEINHIAKETSLPFIIAGDFNAMENSDVIQLLDQSFTRTCYNCPVTFDEDNETGAIDYIAYKKGSPFNTVSHIVIPNKKASDHMPVTAILNMQ